LLRLTVTGWLAGSLGGACHREKAAQATEAAEGRLKKLQDTSSSNAEYAQAMRTVRELTADLSQVCNVCAEKTHSSAGFVDWNAIWLAGVGGETRSFTKPGSG
jgi:hypothetical protein